MIAIGSDHGGFSLKKELTAYLEKKGIEYKDFGTHSDASCDYPDVAIPVAEAVAAGEYRFGILICGTGIGMSIAANKVKGIRAALCHDVYSAKMTRLHNDANVLCCGARIGLGPSLETSRPFEYGFEGGRHSVRTGKISAREAE